MVGERKPHCIRLQCIVYSTPNTELLCSSSFPSIPLKRHLQALCCCPPHTTAAFCWPLILALGISAWQALQLPAYLCRSYGSAPSFDRNWKKKNNNNFKVHQFSHKSAWTELQNSKTEDMIREKEQTGSNLTHIQFRTISVTAKGRFISEKEWFN